MISQIFVKNNYLTLENLLLYKKCISQNIALSVTKKPSNIDTDTVDHLTSNICIGKQGLAIYIPLLVFSILIKLFLILNKKIVVSMRILSEIMTSSKQIYSYYKENLCDTSLIFFAKLRCRKYYLINGI